jgi:hypothetical protein
MKNKQKTTDPKADRIEFLLVEWNTYRMQVLDYENALTLLTKGDGETHAQYALLDCLKKTLVDQEDAMQELRKHGIYTKEKALAMLEDMEANGKPIL